MKNRYDLSFYLTEKFTRFFISRGSVFLFIFLLQAPILIQAQRKPDPETEKQLKKDAANYFDKEDFANAYPIYSQLLSLYPRDPNYNYRFGACLLFTNSDKKKAVKYLEYAAKQTGVENLAYYYLGRALHLNYEFDKAVSFYGKFEQNASPGEGKKFPVSRFIEMCKNGQGLLATSQELDVLRKKELNFSDFIAAYNMHGNRGSLISEPEEFKTKLDKEKKLANLMYVTPDRSKAFFSSYGMNDMSGKDIYVINKKTDGTWGAPENLGNVINTSFDEDYPVYDVPRHTLYFSSKGHNTMGGYDIFASVYNDTTQTWSEPYNLDFPINSPDDDILLLPDTGGQTAFFASARSSPQGKIDVYKIAFHLHPPGSVVIAGTVFKTGGKIPGYAIITVKDSSTNKVVAIDTTSSGDGHYSFNLPKDGKYSFTVEDSTHKGQSQAVILAMEEAKVGITQNIQFDSTGTLKIRNYTSETVKDSNTQLALQYIQNESQMNVNVDTNSIQSLLLKSTSANTNTLVTSSATTNNQQNNGNGSSVTSSAGGSDTNSISSIKNINSNSGTASYDSAKTAQMEKNEQHLNSKAAIAIDYASDKMEEAQQLQEQANDVLNGNGASGTNSDSAAVWLKESKIATEKGMEAYQLAAEFKSEAVSEQLKINKITNANPSSTQANNQGANSNNETSTASTTPGDLIRQQAEQVKQDSTQLAQSNIETGQEITGLQQKSEEFIAQAAQTNDSQQKVALLQQADDLSKSKKQKQEEVKENTEQLQQLHDEYAWLNNKARQADSSYVASANNANPANSTSQAALQQEIDAYAVTNGIDSSYEGTIANNNQGNEIAQNSTGKNGTTNNGNHLHHKRNKNHLSQAGTIAATNNGGSNPDNTQGNNTLIGNNQNTSSGNINNTINGNSQSNNTTSGNQNSLTANNNTTPSSSLNANNNTAGNNNTINGNQNSLTANNTNTTTSSPDGNNNTAGNPQSNSATVSNTTNTSSTFNSTINHPDSTVSYYNTPDKALLDSLANVFSSTNTTSSNYSTYQKSSSVSTVQYTDTVSVTLYQKAQNYFGAANLLTDSIQEIRIEARAEKDKNKATLLHTKIDSINGLVFQLNLKGNEIIYQANTRQYSINTNQIKGISTHYSGLQTDKITAAKKMLKDADYSYKKSLSEKDSANTTTSLSAKQGYTESAKKDLATAILKQQNAVYLYFRADSVQIVSSPASPNSDTNLHFNYSDFLETQAIRSSPVHNNNNSTGTNTNSTTSSENTASSNTTNTKATNNNTSNTSSSQNISAGATNTVTTTNTVSSDPQQLTTTTKTAIILKDSHKSAYSVSNPIPLDPPIPTGLVFGVQVGAFRNSIPPTLFKGFKPIIGLKAPAGFVRYIAGLFTSFDTVKNAEGKIRSIGYPEAFIVAFYGGKRISLKEALAKLGISLPVAAENLQTNNTIRGTETTTENPGNINSSGGSQVPVFAGNSITPTKETLIDTKRKSIRAIKDTVPPAANSINEIKGLVLTVQVGSFSSHKGFTRLRKIKQLYYWNDANGTIKYNSGTYNSVADARAAKDIIVANTSVKDAFVTAYYDGKRITIAEAKNLLGNGKQTINTSIKNTVPSVNTNTVTPVANIYKEVDSSSFALASQAKVIFTIRIASFTGPLPVDTVNKLLTYASEGIEPYKEQEGATAYYAGKFPDYAEATVLQQKFSKGGFPRAIVVAYYHGKKISTQEALAITNK